MELTHFAPFAVSGFCSGPGAAKAVEKQGNPSLTCMEPVGSRERLLPQPGQGVLELHRGRGAGRGVWGAAGMSIHLLPFPTCRKGRHWNTGTHRGILHEDIPAWNTQTHSCSPNSSRTDIPVLLEHLQPSTECRTSLGATRTSQNKAWAGTPCVLWVHFPADPNLFPICIRARCGPINTSRVNELLSELSPLHTSPVLSKLHPSIAAVVPHPTLGNSSSSSQCSGDSFPSWFLSLPSLPHTSCSSSE